MSVYRAMAAMISVREVWSKDEMSEEGLVCQFEINLITQIIFM